MKIGVIGHNGRIGRALVERHDFQPMPCDVLKPETIRKAIDKLKPDVIVHLAAKTDVDFCQDPANAKALDVNLRGAYNVFDAGSNQRVYFLSTDHVFNGKRWFGGYKETDKPDPVNQYGLSKYCAEQLALTFDHVRIIRASTVFSLHRPSIQAYLENLRTGNPVFAPTFIKRSFIHLYDFLFLLEEVIRQDLPNFSDLPNSHILNIAGPKIVSWYTFVRQMAKEFGFDASLVQKRNYENHQAPRGHNLGLDVSKLEQYMDLNEEHYIFGIRRMGEE